MNGTLTGKSPMTPPTVVVWPALLMSPIVVAPLLISGLIANYLRDCHLGRQAELPQWYLPLRPRLSSVTCVCLGVAAVLNPF